MHESATLLVQMTAVAIAVGVLAQVVADRLRLPSIVLLLLFGILVGPDGLGFIDTELFGAGLQAIVTVAMALILFEAGLQLHTVDLAKVGRPVRNLVTVGTVVTIAGVALASHLVAGFPWSMALLLGAILSVTGPTVINPLLDRVRVVRRLDTVLRGEGILIDPIGAILAVVVLELVMTTDTSVWQGLAEFVVRMAIGVVLGLAGGWLLGRLLRVRRLFPTEIKNLVVLAWVLGLFAASEALASESGLAAVVIAGMVVRRESIPQQSRLRRFKGELSILLISILFILLSAHLPLSTLTALGWGGVMTVFLLMWVVRPINILVSTANSELSWRERLFAMWICPRGVVAISIASFIAIRLETGSPALASAGLTAADGSALLALVFLTIAITVVVQGLTAGLAARLLGVSAQDANHVVIVGANPLGRTLGVLLKRSGADPILIDANPHNVDRARSLGLAAIAGNSLDSEIHEQARTEDARTLVSLTANQAINFLVAALAKDEHHVPRVYPVLVDLEKGAHGDLVEEMGGELAFGRRIDVADWNQQIIHERARIVSLGLEDGIPPGKLGQMEMPDGFLPLVTVRGDSALVCHAGLEWAAGDRLLALATPEAQAEIPRLFGAASREPEPEAVVA